MIIQTQGIVLKSFDYRETSRIATFYTRDHGKVSGILKGIRKDYKKFGSSVEKFTVNDLVYYRYRNSDLHLISQCDLRQFFYPVRQDLQRSLAANYVLELVNKIMPVEQKSARVYTLLIAFLDSLGCEKDISKLVHCFQIKLLLFSGFKPHLDSCLKCKKRILDRARFSARDGGLVCSQCRITGGEAQTVSPGTVASLLHIERNPWEDCQKLQMTQMVRRELKYVLNHFLVYHLGKNIRSARFIGQG